jgi:hypothetical protein
MMPTDTDGLAKLKGPAYAIRKKCVDCIGGSEYSEIVRCSAAPAVCKLWPYRSGHGREEGRGYERMTRMKAIRRECLLCTGNSSVEVDRCESIDCALYAYRKGKNPKRAGLGNKNPNMTGLRVATMLREGG